MPGIPLLEKTLVVGILVVGFLVSWIQSFLVAVSLFLGSSVSWF